MHHRNNRKKNYIGHSRYMQYTYMRRLKAALKLDAGDRAIYRSGPGEAQYRFHRYSQRPWKGSK